MVTNVWYQTLPLRINYFVAVAAAAAAEVVAVVVRQILVRTIRNTERTEVSKPTMGTATLTRRPLVPEDR